MYSDSNLLGNEDKRGKSAPYLLISVTVKFLSGFLSLTTNELHIPITLVSPSKAQTKGFPERFN